MTIPPDTGQPESADEDIEVRRRERHNASVDETLVDQGVCAQVHLPTGRICLLEHAHQGSCHFEGPA